MSILTKYRLVFLSALVFALALTFLAKGGVQPIAADAPTAKPTGLVVTTEAGSLNVSLDWDDVSEATRYWVRWRSVDNNEKLNDGISVQSSGVSITVANYGEWVVRVQACTDAGCGKPLAKRFDVEPAPGTVEPTPTPTEAPTQVATPEPNISVPAAPNGLQINTEQGSLDVTLDWNDVDGTAEYWVRWRVAGPGNRLNDGIKVASSNADITVAGFGDWVVRAQACNNAGCGQPVSKRFNVETVPEPKAEPTPAPVTPQPTPEPTPALSTQAAPRSFTATLAANGRPPFTLTAEFSISATEFHTSVNRVGPNEPTEPSSLGSQTLPTPSEEDASDGWFSHSWQVSNIQEIDCGEELAFHIEAYGSGGFSEAVSATAPAIECPRGGLAPQPSGFRAWGDAADSSVIKLRWKDGVSSKWRFTYKATDSDESNSIEIESVSASRLLLSGSSAPLTGGEYVSDATYKLSGLDCGKTYDFSVEGYNEDRQNYQPWTHPASTSANTATCDGASPRALNDPQPPGALTISTRSISYPTISFRFSSASGIDKYRVEYHAVGEDDWATFTDFPPTGVGSWKVRLDGNLACESFYQFRIRARGDGTTYKAVWSSPTTSLEQIYSLDCPPPAADAPAAPVGFSSVGGYLSATFSWDDPQDDSITKYQYRLDLAETGATVGVWTDIPSSGAGTTTYTITGMPRSARYEGYLRAANEHGTGASADHRWVEADVFALPPYDVAAGAPAAPTGFSSAAQGLSEDLSSVSATLSWDDPQDDSITKYQYRLVDFSSEGEWIDIPNSDADTTTYTITTSVSDPSFVTAAGYLRAVNEHGPGAPASYRFVSWWR